MDAPIYVPVDSDLVVRKNLAISKNRYILSVINLYCLSITLHKCHEEGNTSNEQGNCIIMTNYIAENRASLEEKHYVRQARVTDFWFDFSYDKLFNKYKSKYDLDFLFNFV
jgi:hypothetical protein